jgi:hypothetical protein
MSSKSPRIFLIWLCAALTPAFVAAQVLPVTSVSLFSSGVGYFEHRGQVSGDASLSLPFSTAEIDDVLKSLVVRDFAGSKDQAPKAGVSPSVTYPSLESLDEALRDLDIDLSGSPTVADILRKMKGAELAVEAPDAIVGRIVSVEDRPGTDSASRSDGAGQPSPPRKTLVLLTDKGVRALPLDGIVSFRFTDPAIMADFNRALALILGARVADRRSIDIHLPGSGSREVALGYIIAAPVWKASYRLDLSGATPWFQGWAIVDNPGGMDWKGVRLSLVSGRPISFIQKLYAPLMLERPILQLDIGGTAEARTYDSGMGGTLFAEALAESKTAAPAMAPPPAPSAKRAELMSASGAEPPRSAFDFSGSAPVATEARPAGDQFQFTLAAPVSLDRGRSAMFPLISGAITAEKVSIYTADSGEPNPMLGVRLTNSLGMKLPAGPITVFDGGSYAGDALLEFLPEKDKRLVVYGQDLSVIGSDSRKSARETTGVRLSQGVLTFTRRQTFTRDYEFRNASSTPRKLIVEHPIMAGAELLAPKSYEEKTDSLYRFALALPASASASLEVQERLPSSERVVITGLGTATYLAYASSTELSQPLRDAMRRAADLASRLDAAKKSLADLSTQRNDLIATQGRIRQNLEAVGRDSSQGQDYLKRLMDSERALDANAAAVQTARKNQQDAQNVLDTYVAGLDLGN